MNATDLLLADQFTVCSDGLRDFLRRYSAKHLAKVTGAAVATAEGWHEGKWPQSRHMVRLTAEFGRAFLDAVFGPVVSADAPLSLKLARVEDEIKSIRKEIEDARLSPDASGAAGGRGFAVGPVVRAAGAADRRITPARRMIGAVALCLSLLGPVQSFFAPGDDDDWARFFRSKPVAARVVRVKAARREGA